MAKIVKNNIDYTSTPSSASMLPYDNFGSGLDATNVQEAIDEIAEGGGGGGATSLNQLSDVEISGQTVGQVLKYNGYKWANANESGGGGSSTFAELTDVSLNNLQNGQVPKYNSTTQKWENANESGGDLSNYYTKSETNTLLAGKADSADVPQDLQDLDNVTVTSVANGQVLKYNGSNWVNANESGGGSTVSVTQIQSTGTKIATISVDSVATDLYAPNGGGSGGHTIVDEDGTSLTQRTNLQFNGAYLEDNSTDDTTEVNVVREMTKAEFDLLSADEKVGFINITDEIGGGLKYVKEVLWENLDENNMTILSNGSTISLSDNILNYDEVYFEGGFFEINNTAGKKITHLAVTKVLKETIELAKSKYGSGQYEGMFDVAHNPIVSGTTYDSVYCLKVPTDNSLTVAFKYVGGWSANLCTMTRIIGIKYLSETENTYSTDEQIVGKWIDRKTLYARTLVLRENGVDKYTFTGNMSSGGFYAVGLTGIDKIWLDGLYAKRGASGDTVYTDIDNNSSEVVTVFKHSDGSFYFKNTHAPTDIILTIRYTKSS